MDSSVPGLQMIVYLNFLTVLCAQVLNTESMETLKSITKKINTTLSRSNIDENLI